MEKFGLNLSFPLQEKRCSQLRQFYIFLTKVLGSDLTYTLHTTNI